MRCSKAAEIRTVQTALNRNISRMICEPMKGRRIYLLLLFCFVLAGVGCRSNSRRAAKIATTGPIQTHIGSRQWFAECRASAPPPHARFGSVHYARQKKPPFATRELTNKIIPVTTCSSSIKFKIGSRPECAERSVDFCPSILS
jgi:hypothetical protein